MLKSTQFFLVNQIFQSLIVSKFRLSDIPAVCVEVTTSREDYVLNVKELISEVSISNRRR